MSYPKPQTPVALFAPALTDSSGGIWQFYQWVARQVGPAQALLLIAPSPVLGEMPAAGAPNSFFLPFDAISTSVKSSAAYRILVEQAYGRIGGMRVPFYRKVTRHIKQRFYDNDVLGHEIFRYLRRLGVEMLHIPLQHVPFPRLLARLPYVINPHDFQHEHFPQFFTAKELESRRLVWYETQRKAAAIVVHSRQTREDAIKYLGIPEERVFYAPYGPLDTFPEPDEAGLRQAKDDLALPERFIFYPARSWPHKNHLTLVEALYNLKKRGVLVDAVFTTIVDGHGEVIRERIAARGLAEQVTIVGRVSPKQMGALYRLCTMVVVPSLFEQNSGPMLEAIHFGKAVAVSHIDELVTTLDGAGEIFDPRSVSDIADAIDRLWSSEDTLEKAEARICARRAQMSWEPFREVYGQAYEYALAHPAISRGAA